MHKGGEVRLGFVSAGCDPGDHPLADHDVVVLAARLHLCRATIALVMTLDVAAAILFRTCDLSADATGQILVVDGGVSVKFP
jgi:hypothetical protein